MAYQLCMRDEYGQGSILFSDNDLEKVMKRCKQEINSVNVDNALTVEAKKQNWESYMVIIEAGEDAEQEEMKYIYAGKDGRGKDQVFNVDDEIIKLEELEEELSFKMFLGQLDGEDWFASVPSRKVRGEEDMVDSLTHEALSGKNLFYIRPV